VIENYYWTAEQLARVVPGCTLMDPDTGDRVVVADFTSDRWLVCIEGRRFAEEIARFDPNLLHGTTFERLDAFAKRRRATVSYWSPLERITIRCTDGTRVEVHGAELAASLLNAARFLAMLPVCT